MLVTFVRHSESVNNTLWEGMTRPADFELHRHSDAPLTERGVQQAELVGERVAEENGIDATLIFTSYFHRALRTARAIETAVKARHPDSAVRVIVDRDFHEVGGHYHTRADAENSDDAASPPPSSDADTSATGEPSSAAASPAPPRRVSYVGTPGRTSADVAAEFPTFHVTAGQGCETGWWKGSSKETLVEARARALRVWSKLASIASEGKHASVIVITHGHFYAVMMAEALRLGSFSNWAPPVDKTRLSLQNTGVTRVLVRIRPNDATEEKTNEADQTDQQDRSPLTEAERELDRVADIEMLLENCGKHVEAIGSLAPANLPI
jgi:broad specificity phosphatase PhoE